MKPMPRDKAIDRPALAVGEYRVNEIFYSIQGEGVRAGTPMVFVRFTDCNLRCSINNEAGFDCDTEFMSGRVMTLEQIAQEINEAVARQAGEVFQSEKPWLLLTGGEPVLQVDAAFLEYFAGWNVAIETNGTLELPESQWPIRHVCVSPKTAEHTLRLRSANEVKYVRRAGQPLPAPMIHAEHYLLSPAFAADGSVRREDIAWCVKLCLENPMWRLSMQLHKILNVR